ncbi:hypothetical protein FM038_016520 [Shewanella eurypsychrophilus]|uniref:Uncharacterized protein n=1 Tax=Shewanella eurypsychrophilus TaxID=2593656 RepID=A0ABX6V871_9GAMM|nr:MULTISPECIES: hypothetical protein [Shewanella]QFU23619.1 hypothetical protein FS418_18320 [Shewanella sp. YLB-09]QPG58842.1 hypothetical protein FM038_016520 [Shewanella eurypsychrophilus]
MCGTPKANLSAQLPKTPFRSFMASMTLAQRKRFAEVANRAQDRRESRESRALYRQRLSSNPKPATNLYKLNLWGRLKQFCAQTVNLMG